METILQSVAKTGRLVIATESAANCGIAAEIAARMAEEDIYSLDAPIRRVCAKHTPIPFAPVCEADVMPTENGIIEAVKEIYAV
jgi:pyruvate dehydrogenase E1 component beta subunit